MKKKKEKKIPVNPCKNPCKIPEYCELVKNFIILHYPYGPTLTFNEKKERKENPCMKDVNDDASSGLQ